MPGVEKQGDAASCGSHQNTGSPTVFIEKKGMTRVDIDTAGGLIIGPGAQTVFLEGYNASLENDAIVTHGKSPHNAAKTTSTGPTVFAETGFLGDPGEGDVPKSDLNTSVFAAPGPYMTNFLNCPTSYWYMGDVPISYTITNTGNGPTGSFNIGLWEVSPDDVGVPYILPRNSDGVIDGVYPILLAENSINSIPAGGQITGTISAPKGSGTWGDTNPPWWWKDEYGIPDLIYWPWAPEYRAFTLYLDLDNDVGEPNENNSTPTIGLTATYSC